MTKIKIPASIDALISEALAIEAEEAKEAGTVGFMARSMVQATMPHKSVPEHYFKRKNGNYSLTMMADPDIGLPYGARPRLLLAWLTTEAVRTQEREIILGDSLSKFMSELGIIPTGGRWGSITRLKDQMKRLFAASVTATYDDGESWALKNVTPVEEAQLWWNPNNPKQTTLWKSTVTLGDKFFTEIIEHPIPIDMRALQALKASPLALDIYCWLTYRMSYLSNRTVVPWVALQTQFGTGYALTPQGTSEFKRAFLRQLKKVSLIYPEAKVASVGHGLQLLPSKPHVAKLK